MLCALSEDALVAVVLTLAPPSSAVCDDWVFVALTCRALWAAVVRAVREAEHRAICHWRLPGFLHPLVDVLGHRPHTMVTALSGIVCTPQRFQYVKRRWGQRCAHLNALFPARAREAFLRVQYDPRASMRDEYAAYRLSLPLQMAMLRVAPLSMIRGAYFEVVGTSPKRALDLSLPHHQALVSFAAYHGRTDVLNWLVHQNPSKALAFDCDACLIGHYKHALSSVRSTSKHIQNDETLGMLTDLIQRAAALGNSARTVHWATDVVSELWRRFVGTSVRNPAVHLAHFCAKEAFVAHITDAAACGNLAVLDYAFESFSNPLHPFRILSLLVIVFAMKHHSRSTTEWVLRRIAMWRGPVRTDDPHIRTFDEFMAIVDHWKEFLLFGAANALPDMRQNVLRAGDAGYTNWLLSEVELAFAYKDAAKTVFAYADDASFLTSMLRLGVTEFGIPTLRAYLDRHRWSHVYCFAKDLVRQARDPLIEAEFMAYSVSTSCEPLPSVRNVLFWSRRSNPPWVPTCSWDNGETALQGGAAESWSWMVKDALTHSWGVLDAQQMEQWVDVLRLAPMACFHRLQTIYEHFNLDAIPTTPTDVARRERLAELLYEFVILEVRSHTSAKLCAKDAARAACVMAYVQFAHARALFNKRQLDALRTSFVAKECWHVSLTRVLGE